MEKKKLLLIVAFVVSGLSILAGCNSCSENIKGAERSNSAALMDANIVYLSDWKEEEVKKPGKYPVLDAAIKNYEKKYNGKVTFVYSPYAEKQGKFAAMLAAGNPPDVYQPIDGFPQFAVNENAQPIDDLVDLKDPIWKDVKDAYDATEWKGKHRFAVISKGPQDVVWYNKALFEKNGLKTPYDLYQEGSWNWDTFKEAAIKLTQDTDGDGVIDQWGMSMGPEGIVATTGNDLVKINGKDGTIVNNLKNPHVINAFEFFRESGPAKYNIIQPDLNAYQTDFAKGKLAMFMGATWADTVWWPDMMKQGECSFVPAPRYPDFYDYYVAGSANLWMIPKGAPNPEGAAAFFTEFRKAQTDPQIRKAADEDNIKNRGWASQEVEMYNELQKLEYTYVFFPGIGGIGGDRWGMWYDLRVSGLPVESEIEEHYSIWNNEIDIVAGKVKLVHNEAAAVGGTPVIDGEIDDVWENAMQIATDQEKTTPDIATAKVKLLFDADNLYVLAQVSDKKIMTDNVNPWECDSVEIYLDENKLQGNSYDINTVQLRIGADGKMTGSGTAWDGRESALTSAVKKVAGGYIVEAAYRFREVKAEAGSSIGFNIRVNDEEATGKRKGTSVWNPDQDTSYFNPSRFGIVHFK